LFQQADANACIRFAIVAASIVGRTSHGGKSGLPPVVAPIAIAPITIAPIAISTDAISTVAVAAAAYPPLDDERVAFPSALRILDSDHGDSAIVSGIAHQCLAAPAIHTLESKLRYIPRKRTGADHPPPFRGLTLFGDEASLISGDLDDRNLIDIDFDCALT